MKKIFKAVLAICILSVIAIGITGCKEEINIIADPNPYTFVNKGHPVAEYDADMKIDGKLDEARWNAEDQRWLYGVDRPNALQSADIHFTAFYGQKGIFFGLIVEETGNRIWVNHTASRDAGHVNSAVDMYLGPVIEDRDAAYRQTFEFSFIADGEYASRVNQADLIEVLTTYDKLPVVATQPIGGEVNTADCTGYTVEAFFPYTFLEFAGWTLPENISDMVIGINPVHIFSYNYAGSDKDADRLWSNWTPAYGIDAYWCTPHTYFHFGEKGLLSYDYKITYGGSGSGTVTEKNNMPYVLRQIGATFNVEAINGAEITKLTVNGVDYRNKLSYSGATATFTVNNPTEDLNIEVEFN